MEQGHPSRYWIKWLTGAPREYDLLPSPDGGSLFARGLRPMPDQVRRFLHRLARGGVET